MDKNSSLTFKSHILLPLIFVLTLVVAFLFMFDDDFITGLSPFIIYFYFGIAFVYLILAIYDIKTNKEKSPKLKMFSAVMVLLSFIALVLYLVFYLIALGR